MCSCMEAASISSDYVWLLLVHIHTYCNFLFGDTSEFLWSMAVSGGVLWYGKSVFRATRIAPARYYATRDYIAHVSCFQSRAR